MLSSNQVFEAISKSNPGKSDDNGALRVDYFRRRCSEPSVHILLFLSGVSAHGTVQLELQICTCCSSLRVEIEMQLIPAVIEELFSVLFL